MNLTDILIILAVGFNTFWLIKETKFLRGKLKVQSEFIEDAKKIVDLYRGPVADHERIVKLTRERAETETQEAMKQFEKEVKEKALETVHVLRREQEALLKLTIKFINTPTMLRDAKRYLEEMNDDVINKKYLLSLHEENNKRWGNLPNDIIRALIAHEESLQAFVEASRRGREG